MTYQKKKQNQLHERKGKIEFQHKVFFTHFEKKGISKIKKKIGEIKKNNNNNNNENKIKNKKN